MNLSFIVLKENVGRTNLCLFIKYAVCEGEVETFNDGGTT